MQISKTVIESVYFSVVLVDMSTIMLQKDQTQCQDLIQSQPLSKGVAMGRLLPVYFSVFLCQIKRLGLPLSSTKMILNLVIADF